mgnify:CR=1 FL=1
MGEAGMNLKCPNCGTRFKIKDGALGTKGRRVKCGKCDHRWHAVPAVTAAATVIRPADPSEEFAPPPPPPPPPPPAPDDKAEFDDINFGVIQDDLPPIPPKSSFEAAELRPAAKKSGGTMKYWILLGLLLVGGISSAFIYRDLVVHHFPQANLVFKMLNMPANTLGYGLKIGEPKTFLDIKRKTKALGIAGQIINETGKPIAIPLLKAILLGPKGENIKSWTFEAKQLRIDPGEKVEYKTSLVNPPSGATGLQITFTRIEEEKTDNNLKTRKVN